MATSEEEARKQLDEWLAGLDQLPDDEKERAIDAAQSKIADLENRRYEEEQRHHRQTFTGERTTEFTFRPGSHAELHAWTLDGGIVMEIIDIDRDRKFLGGVKLPADEMDRLAEFLTELRSDDTLTTSAIRKWAYEEGYGNFRDGGRIPADVIAKYQEAHPNE